MTLTLFNSLNFFLVFHFTIITYMLISIWASHLGILDRNQHELHELYKKRRNVVSICFNIYNELISGRGNERKMLVKIKFKMVKSQAQLKNLRLISFIYDNFLLKKNIYIYKFMIQPTSKYPKSLKIIGHT